ncbi:MAG TPA: hypothetical protein VFT74_09040, partial [Isosphaeraceae bacterium]|nr:hypothetical protein [Isosphaeraceae bacterium]
FDSASWLGDSAGLRGTLRVERRSDQPFSARFEGELADVDLASLVQNHFPDQRLSGRARVAIRSAVWDLLPAGSTSGWRSAEGQIVASSGRIGGGLLRALGDEMRFSIDLESLARAETADLTFQSLGLDFALRESGEIELAGALGSDLPPGAVIVPLDRLHPLAYAPEGSASVRGLWKMLVPASADVLLPATETAQVLHHLPLPTSTASTPGQRAN